MGFFLSGNLSIILFFVGYVFLIIGVILMLTNLLKMGYGLEPKEWLQVVAINGIVIILTIYLGYANGISTYGWVMTGISLLLIFIASIVLRIFWGSDMGKRWMIGILAAILLAIATVTMSSYAPTNNMAYFMLSHVLYSISGMLMGILYTMRD